MLETKISEWGLVGGLRRSYCMQLAYARLVASRTVKSILPAKVVRKVGENGAYRDKSN